MLKRDVSYEDFNGQRQTDTFYFNLTKTEMTDWDFEGFAAMLQRLVEARDTQALIQEIKKIVLASYGVKSDDGKRFIKSDELRAEFEQTAAYDVLFMELATNDKNLTDFFIGTFPKEFGAKIQEASANMAAIPAMMPPPQPAQ